MLCSDSLTHSHSPNTHNTTAQQQTAKTYQPILIGTNILYLLLLAGGIDDQEWSIPKMLGMALVWALQLYSYYGIVDAAAAHNTKQQHKSQKDLVGGSHLDVLGLTWVVQFGSVLWSTKIYWLLAILPPWAAYSTYKTVQGVLPGAGQQQSSSNNNEPIDDATAQKRQKRAEKRRQKWN